MAEANDRQAKQQEIVEPVKHALEDALAEVDSPQMNTIFYFFTFVYTAGAAWYALMALAFLRDKREGRKLIHGIALPLTIAGASPSSPSFRPS